MVGGIVALARRVISGIVAFFSPLAFSWTARLLFLALLLVPIAAVLLPAVILPVLGGPTLQVAPADVAAKGGNAPATAEGETLAARYGDLKLREAYLASKAELAKGDLVGLIVDLSEGKASLVIKGVPVRVCPIAGYRIDGLTRGMRTAGFLATWTAKPFVTLSQSGTVVKKPIRIKEAPKDEKEYEAQSSTEATPIEEGDVHCVLEFDRGLTLALEQTQPDDWKARWGQLRYDLSRSWETALRTLRRLAGGKLPEHGIFIEIKLARDDVKAIYRSIPEEKAGMALKL